MAINDGPPFFYRTLSRSLLTRNTPSLETKTPEVQTFPFTCQTVIPQLFRSTGFKLDKVIPTSKDHPGYQVWTLRKGDGAEKVSLMIHCTQTKDLEE